MAHPHHYGLILAGGRGTRFWPLSRKARAKQVLSFFGERTLIQQTVDRLQPILPLERIWILTNDLLRKEIVRQLPGIPARQILAEPASRNTAPAIGLAAEILHRLDPQAVMGVFPSDHIVQKPNRYRQFVRAALKAADQGKLVCLGIEPRWAETGYGYLEFPPGSKPGTLTPYRVERFREKPDLATAQRFLDAGHYGWNAGMFFWRAGVFLDELRQHLPRTAALLAGLPAFGQRSFGRALADAFPACDNISVDFAVMEKSANVFGLACDDVGWNDAGSWNAVYELEKKDPLGNAVRADAVFTELASGNYVNAPGKLVAVVGVKDLVIVDTPDALLVTTREQAQKVGDIVKLLEQEQREELT